MIDQRERLAAHKGFTMHHQDETIYNHGVNIKITNPSFYVEFHDGNHYTGR